MMNIDNAIGIVGNKVFAQHLHIAGQHDQLDARERSSRSFLAFLPFLGLRTDGKMEEGNPVTGGNFAGVGMVADDDSDFRL